MCIEIPPRRVPKTLEGEEEKIIQQQLEAGVIRESQHLVFSSVLCSKESRKYSGMHISVKDSYP